MTHTPQDELVRTGTYSDGCRCDLCRQAHVSAAAKRRAARKAAS